MRRWITTLILCYVNVVHFMERFTVSGVLSKIKSDYNLEFWQGGLLQTGFVVCYCIFAPIFGYLGDRYSQLLLALVKQAFPQLHPLFLEIYFSNEIRSIVLAAFYFAIPVGSGLGYIIGDKVGQLAGDWRWGLRVTPFLTLIGIILMFMFLLDPERGVTEEIKTSKTKSSTSLLSDFLYLSQNKSYVCVTIAYTFLTFAIGALTWWGPFLVEEAIKVRDEYGYDTSNEPSIENVPFYFGIVMVVAGISGLVLGSFLSIKLRNRFPRIDPIICGTGLLLSCPFLLCGIAFSLNGINQTYALIFLGQTFLNTNWAITVDMSMYVVLPTVRSTAEGFQLMATHALGEAGSPYLIGLLTDYIRTTNENTTTLNPEIPQNSTISDIENSFYSLQTSIYLTIISCILSGIFFLFTVFFIVKDKKNVEDQLKKEAELSLSVIT
ncbi:SPNS [Lepeophtheirus salmonis]|uniref:SPNS n=1 Tax=Lepeophtheirus salmonis TaxID=72036 RepID=A0A7R8CWA9_LEPSM|nr:SPNS [Lepeophtheirus salmonis]CAF2951612.1 SPNS [Lepeophtheirus salmonis]